MIGILIAAATPYKTRKDKLKIVKRELGKNKTVEVFDKGKVIYSALRGGTKSLI